MGMSRLLEHINSQPKNARTFQLLFGSVQLLSHVSPTSRTCFTNMFPQNGFGTRQNGNKTVSRRKCKFFNGFRSLPLWTGPPLLLDRPPVPLDRPAGSFGSAHRCLWIGPPAPLDRPAGRFGSARRPLWIGPLALQASAVKRSIVQYRNNLL